jgi:hypothetical protein
MVGEKGGGLIKGKLLREMVAWILTYLAYRRGVRIRDICLGRLIQIEIFSRVIRI